MSEVSAPLSPDGRSAPLLDEIQDVGQIQASVGYGFKRARRFIALRLSFSCRLLVVIGRKPEVLQAEPLPSQGPLR
jgi:hypothetical protein